jgi:tripartite-type tricarboxylate transporter receptor subunit TctC
MKRVFALLLSSVLSLDVLSQGFPSRPVRLVVPLSPGGFADVPARMLAPRLQAALGRPVVVDNRPGAGGTIGANEVAKAAPDGHTLLVAATPLVISAHLYRSLPYDTLKDFVPVAMVGSGPYALVVNAHRLPVAGVRELIAAAKAQPGKIDFASSGNGSAQHLVGALFNSMAGVELNHVPYKGSGPAMQDLLGGQIAVSFAGIPNVLSAVRSGKLRALAVTTRARWSELPEVPTLDESGVAGYEATLWLGLAAPAQTPPEIVARLQAEVTKLLHDPELRQSFRGAGIEAQAMSPQEFANLLRAEHGKWGKVVRDTGATVN